MSETPAAISALPKETTALIATPIDVEKQDTVLIEVVDENTHIPYGKRLGTVLMTTWSLGFVAFGDSFSQAAIIQDQICCSRRGWLDEDTFMELFALSHALPGPLGTQLVIGAAMAHAGAWGGFLAMLIWVLPGAILLTLAGTVMNKYVVAGTTPLFLVGIPPATVALVFKAAYGFGSRLDKFEFFLAGLSCAGALILNGDSRVNPDDSQFMYPAMLAAGGLLTLIDSYVPWSFGDYTRSNTTQKIIARRIGIPMCAAGMLVQFWLIILLGTTLLQVQSKKELPLLDLFSSFFRIGSVTFGGGEDVLAMVKTQMVPKFLTSSQFFQGLGLSQILPGPCLNLAAFVGVSNKGILGAVVSTLAIFTPAYMFMLVGMSFWARLRQLYWFRAALGGVNAVGVGFIAATCIFLWESSVVKAADGIVCTVALGLSTYYHCSPLFVIIAAILVGAFFEKMQLAQVAYN